MSEILRQMPLVDQIIEYKNLTIKPIDTGVVMVQKSDIVANTHLDMPVFGTMEEANGISILSVMPDVWMILSALDKVGETLAMYQTKIGDDNIVLTDMSDQYLQLDLSGKHVRALLAKGCELDLSLDKFTKNSTARSLLAHLNVVIYRGNGDGITIVIDASYAEHLWLWLEGAAQEYSKD